MNDLLQDKRVKCKKPHRCAWCNESIPAGATAHYRVYTFDGYFQTDYLHPECYTALSASDISYDEGFEAGAQLRGKTIEESDL